MSSQKQYTSIGGQAVIEGVMMRSPHFITVAVRKPNRQILLRSIPYTSITQRFPWLKKPVFRGVVILFESMIQGVRALSYSAEVASTAEADGKKGEELSGWAIALSIITAIIFGLGLFVALPHLLTALATSSSVTVESPLFHLIDGVFKVAILIVYVILIGLMKDIRRVFQYHGAEHKSIYAFEAGEDLVVESAKKHTTLHPRCGTSFLLFLVIISILVFSFVFPLFGLTKFSANPVVNHTMMVFVKIILMFPVAGLAYEFIKACALRMDSWLFRLMIWPGLMLQKLTTHEPDDEQLEVALASLKQVLWLEKNAERKSGADAQILGKHSDSPDAKNHEAEIEIAALSEISAVPAQVKEFPEL